jgi:hypothetical protein
MPLNYSQIVRQTGIDIQQQAGDLGSHTALHGQRFEGEALSHNQAFHQRNVETEGRLKGTEA